MNYLSLLAILFFISAVNRSEAAVKRTPPHFILHQLTVHIHQAVDEPTHSVKFINENFEDVELFCMIDNVAHYHGLLKNLESIELPVKVGQRWKASQHSSGNFIFKAIIKDTTDEVIITSRD